MTQRLRRRFVRDAAAAGPPSSGGGRGAPALAAHQPGRRPGLGNGPRTDVQALFLLSDRRQLRRARVGQHCPRHDGVLWALGVGRSMALSKQNVNLLHV